MREAEEAHPARELIDEEVAQENAHKTIFAGTGEVRQFVISHDMFYLFILALLIIVYHIYTPNGNPTSH